MAEKTLGKALTWSELADIFDKETGRRARTLPTIVVLAWAERQTEKFVYDEEGRLHQIIEEPQDGHLSEDH